jgi:hypothetical protein
MKVAANRPYRASQLGLDDPDSVIFGVYVGGCIHERNAWGIWDGTRSHAHNNEKNEFYGWICILDPADVLTPRGQPTSTLLHEVAHLMCPNQLHSRAWKKAVTALGAAAEIARCGLTTL